MNIDLEPWQIQEITKCVADPAYFVENYCWLEQKASAGVSDRTSVIPFTMGTRPPTRAEIEARNVPPEATHYFQRQILYWLHERKNVLTLKSRRVGCSWIAAAYVAWLINFHENINVLFISRTGSEAKKILDKVRFILKNLAHHDNDDIRKATLASWLRGEVNTDNTERMAIGWRSDEGMIVYESMVDSITTTDNAARGNDATFIVFDELAFYEHPNETWSSAMPTLAHGGHWMAISCVTPDTFIFTEHGVEQIGDYMYDNVEPGQFGTIPEVRIYGRFGLKTCSTTYNSGYTPTLKFSTQFNYQIETSHIHPILCIRDGELDWIKARDLRVGDYVPIQYGMNCWGTSVSLLDCYPEPYRPSRGKTIWLPPDEITEDIAYLLGLITGDGHIDDGFPYRVNIATVDSETKEWLLSGITGLDFSVTPDGQHLVASSKAFIDFCRKFGMSIGVRASSKKIPKRIMTAPKNIVSAFLQGLFDADGYSKKDGYIGYSSTSEAMISQVRAILLNFGIISVLRTSITKPTKRVSVESIVHKLEIGTHSREFYQEIGFRLTRKQVNSVALDSKTRGLKDSVPFASLLVNAVRGKLPQLRGNPEFSRKRRIRTNRATVKQAKKYPFALSKKAIREILEWYPEAKDREAYRKLDELVNLPYYWVKINSIEEGYNYTCDFSIPDGHSFISNGFISHNTPGGLGDVFHRLCVRGDLAEKGQLEEELGYEYIKIHWSEAGINSTQVNKSIIGATEETAKQEWEWHFIAPGTVVFHPTHLAACFKPPDEFPEVAAELAEYRRLVDISKLERTGVHQYFSGVDTAAGKAHRKSNEKDYHCFTALTRSGIQAMCYYSKEQLSKWAGATFDDPTSDGKIEVLGKVSQLHQEYPGSCYIEEEGPGYTTLNRHMLPDDGFSQLVPVSMKQKMKRGIIERLILAVESHQIIITDLFTYQCMQVYQQTAPGVYEAPSGYFDDPVMALAIAYENLLRYGAVEFSWGATADGLKRALPDLNNYNGATVIPLDIPGFSRRMVDELAPEFTIPYMDEYKTFTDMVNDGMIDRLKGDL